MTLSSTINDIKSKDFRDYFYKDALLSSISDKEIDRAILEAKTQINESLTDDTDTLTIMFMYLTAHYACLNARMGGINSAGQNIIVAESAEGVSATYSIPDKILKSPVFSAFAKTEYGYRYLSLVYPYCIGNISVVEGSTTP